MSESPLKTFFRPDEVELLVSGCQVTTLNVIVTNIAWRLGKKLGNLEQLPEKTCRLTVGQLLVD